jgi:23S rRNA pseudouridine2605 synthase
LQSPPEPLERAMSEEKTSGDRIAKVMARAGIASRRDAERMILEGRVAVNGKAVSSPALDIQPGDQVTLDGKPIDAPQPARLWFYYKPLGLVTSNKDEKGRQTVFDTLPKDMPRVMSIGRLDLNSEGLLLLTNDGDLKRKLELPSTGWLRKYRVRVNGRPNDATFDPLRRGVKIEGEDFLPMEVSLDRQQGANAWLTVGLREGKNREIRRAMTEVGMIVNRLIRVSYGPFRLNTMKPGDVVEVKQRVLREQLGEATADRSAGGTEMPRRGSGPAGVGRDGKPRPARTEGGAFDRKSRPSRPDDARGDRKPRAEGATFDRKPRPPRSEGDSADRKPRRSAADGDRYERKPRVEGADQKHRSDSDGFKPRGRATSEDRKPRQGQGADAKGTYGKPKSNRPAGAGDREDFRAERSRDGASRPQSSRFGGPKSAGPKGAAGRGAGTRSGAAPKGGGAGKPPRGSGKK